ncbi:hypothetical protein SGRIM119S_02563 [Streptomyces griseorubiginosus]
MIGLLEPLLFPNGMLLTADGTAVVVAETLAMRLTRLPTHGDGTLEGPQPWAALISPLLWRLVNHPGLSGRITRRISALLDHPAIAKCSASPVAPDGIAWDTDGETIWVANALRANAYVWQRAAVSSIGWRRASTRSVAWWRAMTGAPFSPPPCRRTTPSAPPP